MKNNTQSTFLLVVTFLLFVVHLSQGVSDKYEKLIKTSVEKKSGIAEFSGDSLKRYAKSDRDFSLVVLLTTEKKW